MMNDETVCVLGWSKNEALYPYLTTISEVKDYYPPPPSLQTQFSVLDGGRVISLCLVVTVFVFSKII
jgi:hypothetical protein